MSTESLTLCSTCILSTFFHLHFAPKAQPTAIPRPTCAGTRAATASATATTYSTASLAAWSHSSIHPSISPSIVQLTTTHCCSLLLSHTCTETSSFPPPPTQPPCPFHPILLLDSHISPSPFIDIISSTAVRRQKGWPCPNGATTDIHRFLHSRRQAIVNTTLQ